MTPDTINGIFELLGGVLIFANVWKLYKDKCVRGVSWLVMLFFVSWGFWNLYFYPFYDLWISFAGGVMISVANVWWIILAGIYIRREKRNDC